MEETEVSAPETVGEALENSDAAPEEVAEVSEEAVAEVVSEESEPEPA